MNKKLVMALFIIFIMISSVFGFIFGFGGGGSGESRVKYGDYKFRVVQNQYVVKIDGEEHRFLFFPGDVEYIQLSSDVRRLLEAPVLTVSYDPTSEVAESLGEAQYYFELQLQGKKTIERALLSDGSALPVKTCDDASEAQPVIVLQSGEASNIVVDGNCMTVTALDAYDLFQQTERILYGVLGVIE